MKTTLLITSLLFTTVFLFGQTVIYSEDFNGTSHSFTLNSSDVSSTTTGYNQWIVNNSYNGGSFNEPCFGISTNVANTPNQPGAITGAPNSNYLHIVNTAAQSAGISNANFLASDGGFLCNNDENYFAKMTSDISTVGFTNVTFSCYYLCAGSSATYGELYYSTDGGSSWQLQLGNIYNVSSWQTLTQTNPTWNNQSTLRFGFRFVNNSSFSASDPPFAIDEIAVTGTVIISNSISTNAILNDTLCPGDSLIVNYTATGTFNAGNVFTAELSDELGSFSSPIAIGSISSTVSGSINAVIPLGTVAGTGYRIRVVSSNPSVMGSDNGNNLVIGAYPTPNFNSTVNGFNVQFIDNSTGGTAWYWDFGDGNTSTLQNPMHTYATADTFTVCLIVKGTAGCEDYICRTVMINPPAGINENLSTPILIYPNPAESFVILNSELFRSGGILYLYATDGRMIKSTIIPNGSTIFKLMLDDLSAGVYTIHFVSNNMNINQTIIKK